LSASNIFKKMPLIDQSVKLVSHETRRRGLRVIIYQPNHTEADSAMKFITEVKIERESILPPRQSQTK
jgi:hypothetical protein